MLYETIHATNDVHIANTLSGMSSGILPEQKADCMLQDVVREMLALMPTLLVRMDRHLGQSRIAKAAMLRPHLTSNRGDTRHQLLTMPK